MSKNISIIAGPCAAESEAQVMNMAYKISRIRDVVEPYGIQVLYRAGAWKPRTKFYNGGSKKERVFEGAREDGLVWLSQAAEQFNLPIVSEAMSEMDLRHFGRYLEPERDVIQVGTRTSQAFALLYEIGGTRFAVLHKAPQHGVDPAEAIGSLQRYAKNRQIAYGIRGQKIFIHPNGKDSPEHRAYMEKLLTEPEQDPNARNLNNIGSICLVKDDPYFRENGILLCYDPSHTFGGKTHQTRKKIGEFAIKAITDYGYDWVMVEVNDESGCAKCDADQALFTTLNGIDWSKTLVKEEPADEDKPLTLVDITKKLMHHQVTNNGISRKLSDIPLDYNRLDEIRWDMTA